MSTHDLTRANHENGTDNEIGNRLWYAAGVIYRGRKFAGSVTVAGLALSVVISLLLPNWYAASARLLSPEGGGNPLTSSLLRNMPSAAAMLLGGPSGDYARYLTILTSRSMLESAVDSFDLVSVYDTHNSRYPREDAIDALRSNIDFPVHEKYEYLSVVVYDKDPQRAADISNFLVRRLNLINSELTSQTAALFRSFVERRYAEANAALDSVLDASQAFQAKYGVFDLSAQTMAFFDQVASTRSQAVEVEIRYEALRAQLGDNNPQVQSMRELVDAANRQYRQILAGQEQVLPVPQEDMSAVMREYIDLEREALIQSSLIEVIVPILEQARFNEGQQVQAVQVVDPAVPPAKKAKPSRTLIVLISTVSVFLVAIIFVLVMDWWQRHHQRFAHKLGMMVSNTPRPRAEV